MVDYAAVAILIGAVAVVFLIGLRQRMLRDLIGRRLQAEREPPPESGRRSAGEFISPGAIRRLVAGVVLLVVVLSVAVNAAAIVPAGHRGVMITWGGKVE